MKNLQISFNKSLVGATVADFWQWAYSNIETPLIRGVLLEFALHMHLIKNIDELVLARVRRLSLQSPRPGDLEKSLLPFYKTQPHGDVFDLQLTWGVTVEIKSTSCTKNWNLKKTCRWNSIKNRNKKEKKFPAQYYILAVLGKEPSTNTTQLDFSDAIFYVCTGRALDEKVPENKKSIGFNKFTKISQKCEFSELISKLHELQSHELERVLSMLEPDWKQPTPPSYDKNYLPLAVEEDEGKNITTGWFLEKHGKLEMISPIEVKWVSNAEPDWRDWEAVGFKYEPEIEVKESPAVIKSTKPLKP